MFGDLPFGMLLGLLSLAGPGPGAQEKAQPQSTTQSATKVAEIEQKAGEAFRQNRFDDAAKLYREAVRLRPQWAEGWGYLAAALFSRERYREAEAAYRRTTVLTPRNGPSWAYLGFCEYELRDYRPAFEHLVKSRQLDLGRDPELLSRVHYELAMLWDTAGQFEMGTKELMALADANPSVDVPNPVLLEATGLNVLRMPVFPYEIPPAKHDLVMKAGEAGWKMNGHRVEDARRLYEQLLVTYPKDPNLHYAYGFTLAASDQEAAVAELEKELAISPRHVPAMVEAALLSLEMGQREKSEKLARRAIAIEPNNYAPHNILGRILVGTDHPELGIAELETAVRLAPKIAATHFSLAQAYQKAGRGAAAAREFAAFRQLSPGPEGQEAGAQANP
jgi:tetratricopeptide (TPR) repeat protein